MSIDYLSTLDTIFQSNSFEKYKKFKEFKEYEEQKQKRIHNIKEKLTQSITVAETSPQVMEVQLKQSLHQQEFPTSDFQELSPEEKCETIQSTFNGLTGLEVLRIYEDSPFFKQLMSSRQQYPQQIDQLLWRITYIVGELLMIVQNHLLKQNLLQKCYVFTVKDISDMSTKIVQLEQSNSFEDSDELNIVKIMLQQIYKQGYCETEKAIRIYSFFLNYCFRYIEFTVEIIQEKPQKVIPEKKIENKKIQTDKVLAQDRATLTEKFGEEQIKNIKMRSRPGENHQIEYFQEYNNLNLTKGNITPNQQKQSQMVAQRPFTAQRTQQHHQLIQSQAQPPMYLNQQNQGQSPRQFIKPPYPALQIKRTQPQILQQSIVAEPPKLIRNERNNSNSNLKYSQMASIPAPMLVPQQQNNVEQEVAPQPKKKRNRAKKNSSVTNNFNNFANILGRKGGYRIPTSVSQPQPQQPQKPQKFWSSYANPGQEPTHYNPDKTLLWNGVDSSNIKKGIGRPTNYPQSQVRPNINMTNMTLMQRKSPAINWEKSNAVNYKGFNNKPVAPQWVQSNPQMLTHKNTRFPMDKKQPQGSQSPQPNMSEQTIRKPMVMPKYNMMNPQSRLLSQHSAILQQSNVKRIFKQNEQPEKNQKNKEDSIFVESEEENPPTKKEVKTPKQQANITIPDIYKNPSIPHGAIPKCNILTKGEQQEEKNTEEQKQPQAPQTITRERFTKQQDQLIVPVFIDTKDYDQCSKSLIEKFGNQTKFQAMAVKHRIEMIVRKVHEKFKSLKTNNDSINKFKQNWDFISKRSDLQLRKDIYKHIVIIYTAMLNMNEAKRELISNKIIQINKLCVGGSIKGDN